MLACPGLWAKINVNLAGRGQDGRSARRPGHGGRWQAWQRGRAWAECGKAAQHALGVSQQGPGVAHLQATAPGRLPPTAPSRAILCMRRTACTGALPLGGTDTTACWLLCATLWHNKTHAHGWLKRITPCHRWLWRVAQCQPWSPASHGTFPRAFRAAARTLLLVARRHEGLRALPQDMLHRLLAAAAYPLSAWQPHLYPFSL